MQMPEKLISITVHVIAFLPFVYTSQEHEKSTGGNYASKKNSMHRWSPKLSFEVTVHGFLLWASMGFLMPAGILSIRMSHRVESRRKLKILFYVHYTSQVVSLLLATAGAVMSIKNFDNSFSNHHQRIGVALYGMIWLQAIVGFIRPHRGSRRRSVWFFVHWIHGTAVSLLGVINVFTGLVAYHQRTSRRIEVWGIVFTIQLSLMAFFYLFQEKWVYIQKQGVILGNPTDHARDDLKMVTTQSF
ncbi:hypothetical protein K2173_018890 [Erythroxylum novogranatense]|uniref:Cytochrome b561 domain-containing protein n=1 Tax=Erythroxylum novogranatense TaxID=1862640 RepID=A0AAV8SB48_9ROSI|nr:hypothetical protein K2173_018890 [Erythroxylum novogranatense]